MVGLHSGTHSTLAVVGGIIAIAIADACSDALGVHIAEESRTETDARAVWEATASTLLTKAVIALTFLVPVLLLELDTAILASVLWGVVLVAGLSYRMARAQGASPVGAVSEHVVITLVVVALTHYVGDWVAATFGAR